MVAPDISPKPEISTFDYHFFLCSVAGGRPNRNKRVFNLAKLKLRNREGWGTARTQNKYSANLKTRVFRRPQTRVFRNTG